MVFFILNSLNHILWWEYTNVHTLWCMSLTGKKIYGLLFRKNELNANWNWNSQREKKINKNKQNLQQNNSTLKPTRTMEDNENVNKSTPPSGFNCDTHSYLDGTLSTLCVFYNQLCWITNRWRELYKFINFESYWGQTKKKHLTERNWRFIKVSLENIRITNEASFNVNITLFWTDNSPL